MAFQKQPDTWFASWQEDGTTISVPIASFPELTAVEADGTTGDIRKILFALLERLNVKWLSVAAADRPGKMTVQKSQVLNPVTGEITATYSVTFTLQPASVDVAAES